jgi:hypothetical protein
LLTEENDRGGKYKGGLVCWIDKEVKLTNKMHEQFVRFWHSLIDPKFG